MTDVNKMTDEEVDALIFGEDSFAQDALAQETVQENFIQPQRHQQAQEELPKPDRTSPFAAGLPPKPDPQSPEAEVNRAVRSQFEPELRQSGKITEEFSDDDIDFLIGIQDEDKVEEFGMKELEAQLQAEGVDTKTGAPTGLRAQLSVQTDQRIRDDIIRSAGFEIEEDTALGRVIRTKDGKKLLLDETEMTFNDFVDSLGLISEVGGSVGTAAAFFTLAPPALAASGGGLVLATIFAAVGGQAVRGGAEFFTALANGGMDLNTEEGIDRLETILANGGTNALLDVTLDLLFQSGYFLRNYGPHVAAKIKATLANTKSKLTKGKTVKGILKDELDEAAGLADKKKVQGIVEESIERSGAKPGELSPGLETGSVLIQRFLGMIEKFPFVGQHVRKMKAKDIDKITGFQNRLLQMMDTLPGFAEGVRKTLAEHEGDVAKNLISGNEFLELLATGGRREARALARGQLDNLANKLSPMQTKFSHAGDAARKEVILKEATFQDMQTELATNSRNIMRQLPPAEQKFVRQTKIREQFRKVRAKGVRNASGQFIIEGVPAKINSLNSLIDKMFTKKGTTTVENMRSFRQILNDEIRNPTGKFEGIQQADLKLLANAATDSINDSIKIIKQKNPALAKALTKEINHYKANVDRFNNDHVSKIFRKDGIKDADILPELFFKKGGKKEIEQVFDAIGEDSTAAFVNKRSVFSRMLRDSTDEGAGLFGSSKTFDPDKIFNRINQMKENETYDILIRDKGTRDEIDRLVSLLRAESGGIGVDSRMLSAFNAGTDTEKAFVDSLQKSLDIERELQENFSSSVLNSLKNGTVPNEIASGFTFQEMRKAVDGNAEGIIDRILKLDVDTLGKLMETWPPTARQEFQSHVIAVLLQRGSKLSALPDERILSFVEGKQPVARELLAEMSFLSPTTTEAKRKLSLIFGKETFKDLQAMGVLGEKLLEGDRIASVVGGLIAGSQAARFVRSGPKAVASELAKWSALGRAVEHAPKLRRLLAKMLPKGTTPRVLNLREKIIRANLPEIIRLTGEAVAEDSELTRFIEETTGKNAVTFVRDMFGVAGGEVFREDFGTSTRKKTVRKPVRQKIKSPEQVTDELFNLAPGSAVRPVP